MVARQSSGPMKTNHAWIADSHAMALHGHSVELWGYFWSFPFLSDANEVFDANYEDANLEEDSDENPLRLKVCVRLGLVEKADPRSMDPPFPPKCWKNRISRTSTVAPPSQCDISDLSALSSQFSREEQASLLEKAKAILLNETYRKGFQDRVYFVDSGGALPYRVQCCNNGNCSCGCSFFSRNNFCHHCLAIAIHLSCVPKVTEAYKGRSLTKVSTATARRNVGGKMPSRKRKLPEASPSNQPDAVAEGCNFHSEVVNPTTVVIRKQARPVDPPSSAPWVLKIISGGIRKCAGCRNAIRTNIVGYQTAEDQMYCFGRFEAYHFWNKMTNCWQLASSTRHYHINPVCTQAGSQQLFTIRIGSVNLTESLRLLIVERFGCNPESGTHKNDVLQYLGPGCPKTLNTGCSNWICLLISINNITRCYFTVHTWSGFRSNFQPKLRWEYDGILSPDHLCVSYYFDRLPSMLKPHVQAHIGSKHIWMDRSNDWVCLRFFQHFGGGGGGGGVHGPGVSFNSTNPWDSTDEAGFKIAV